MDKKYNILIYTPDSITSNIGGLSVQINNILKYILEKNKNWYIHIISPIIFKDIHNFFDNYSEEVKRNNRIIFYELYHHKEIIKNQIKKDMIEYIDNSFYLYSWICQSLKNNIKPDLLISFDYNTITSSICTVDYYRYVFNYKLPWIFACSLSLGETIKITDNYFKIFQHSINNERIIAHEHKAFISADSVIFNSDWYKNYFISILQPNINVIPNGVNIDEIINVKPLDRTQLPGKQKYKIAYIGRLSSNKGLPLMVDCKMRPKNTDIIIIGDVNPDLEDDAEYALDLENIISKEQGGIPSLHFVGKKSKPELYSWIKALDMVIMPAICEPFCICSLEVQVCKTLLMYNDIPGLSYPSRGVKIKLPENFQHAFEYLKQQIEITLNMKVEEKKKIIQEAYNRIVQSEEFNWEKISEIYEKCFKKHLF
jgi:glycosyltransferase involved in cell wall biosynthesis